MNTEFEKYQTVCCTGLFGRGKQKSMECRIFAMLTKPIYYNDESIVLDIEIDNRRSKQAVYNIEVTLRQNVLIKR